MPSEQPANRFSALPANGNQPLDAFFYPQRVAVIGATDKPGSVGRSILENLIRTPFGGTLYPVNPGRNSVLGIRAAPTITSIGEPIDLAVIVTPAASVPAIIGECSDAHVRAAIVISAGFKESGTQGVALEQQILEQAQRGQMRIIGPNCLGLMFPRTGLNATFASRLALPGSVAFISQSGALCTAVLDWSLREHVGFSAFVSIGSMLDVGWGDLIDYLGDDPDTRSIVMYMETIGDARSFLSAAREVALSKPIIVIKAGRSEAAARAAASHTGALAGSDAVLDAAFERCGVLRVNSIADLFAMAEVLAKQPRPAGPRLTILTNAGGPGVLATDALISSAGNLAQLSPTTLSGLNKLLPAAWSHNNPIDILGDADPQRYAAASAIAAHDLATDGVMVILTPQAMTDPTQTAEQVAKQLSEIQKPVLASWMGGADVRTGEAILNRYGIPTFEYPDLAAHAFGLMWKHSRSIQGLYETPVLEHQHAEIDRTLAQQILQTAQREQRIILTEHESKQLLRAYSIPIVETHVATSVEQALEYADQIGYPVVLKLYSTSITHKTDVGGVRLNLVDAAAVRHAYQQIEAALAQHGGAGQMQGVTVQPMISGDGYELILGSSIDQQFGPVLLFGSGGQLVEVYEDRALALPPLTTTLAKRLIEHTRISKALHGVRGRKPIDLDKLAALLVRFSQLVVEQRRIAEIEINPLFVTPERMLALDARVVLHPHERAEQELPRLAIRPYPAQYAQPWYTNRGEVVLIRPIRPEDEPLMVAFHQTLSEQSVFYRYFQHLPLSQRITHERLLRLCFIDYDREMALVVDRTDPTTNEHQLIGVGRLRRIHGGNDAEFALIVSDAYQHQGLGRELLRRLLQIAHDEALSHVIGYMLPDNMAMCKICEQLGFRLQSEPSTIGQPHQQMTYIYGTTVSPST
jgi:acetyltransferase